MSLSTLRLLGGGSMPWIAFGTGTALYQKDCTDACKQALESGFTHLDAAQMYQNEEFVGEAIATSGLDRKNLFITTKLSKLNDGETVEESLRKSLEKLKVDHVDLFLIHVPSQHESRPGGISQVWREMVDAKNKGLAKSVGVSNFSKGQLQKLIKLGVGVPEVNQIEYHPLVAAKRKPLIDFSNANNIITASYGGLTPILPNRNASIDAGVRNRLTSVLDELAKARGPQVTQNQILLKWLQKQGILAVTTSSRESRVKEYLSTEKDVADLTNEDMEAISAACGDHHFSAFASFSWVDRDDTDGDWP